MPRSPRRLFFGAAVCGALYAADRSAAQEFRAMWADTFHAGLRNSSEVTTMVNAARAGNFNALVVEIRKRGDAYYRNGLEPVATDVAAGFDPLADLIQKAHSGSPRIEVHAWMVTFNIWNNESTPPAQPTHPYNLHPDWLTRKNTGEQFDGSNYQFDPGHPEVQQHTFDVAMDILSRYNVDGIHFDYIRYTESGSSINNQPWGYNPVAVDRFKRLKNQAATPAPTDSLWLQWRRDQVTALLRKVYLHAWATKPQTRVTAALIPWGNPPANLTLSAWQGTNAYARVLQDWRAWMEEGILDLACPMVYRNESTTPGFDGWADFAKDRQYDRAAAIGMGWYLNSVANTIDQVKIARSASPGGRTGSGIVGYSYAVTNNESVSRAEMLEALTDDATAETYDPGGTPVFPTAVSPPTMPWKTNTTRGHLMGFVIDAATQEEFDGATVSLTGPVARTLTTDATGFFGSVDLPVGTYTLTVAVPGYLAQVVTVPVTGAQVAEVSFPLEAPYFQINSAVWNAAGNALTLSWPSIPGHVYRIDSATDLTGWSPVMSNITATAAATSRSIAAPVGRRFFRVIHVP